jgi:hypothetical protein
VQRPRTGLRAVRDAAGSDRQIAEQADKHDGNRADQPDDCEDCYPARKAQGPVWPIKWAVLHRERPYPQAQGSNATPAATSVKTVRQMALVSVSNASVSTKPIGSRKLLGSCRTVRISFLIDGPEVNRREGVWFERHITILLGILFGSCDALWGYGQRQRSSFLAVEIFGRSTTALGRTA